VTAFDEAEKRAWLRLARTQNIGPSTFAALIARFGSARRAIEEVPNLARRGGGEPLRIPSDTDAAREIEALAKRGGRLIASCEPEFPSGLAALEAPPPVISVLGRASIVSRETVAIVGARNASALGRKLAATLAQDLGAAGLVIASGMARGIDTAAHEGALETGTVAVLAGGVDNIYPPENAALYERLSRDGAIVSEMAFGQVPQARHFPRRNRIISGLSRGVIVVEAAEGSGSLITANYALEQNREIFAVPGSPLDPRAKGTNRLIRQGAVLTETAEDVLSTLKPIIGSGFGEPECSSYSPENEPSEPEMARIRRAVAEALGPSPVAIDEIVRLVGASPGPVLIALLELELAGRITREPGNRVVWA
jgi:DNA processing protein